MKALYLFTTEVLLIWLCALMIMEEFMISKKWIKAAVIRAVKTMAQTAIATIGTAAAMGGVDWIMVASSATLAGILSVLTSLAGIPEVDRRDDFED